jgi:hypothetical protein
VIFEQVGQLAGVTAYLHVHLELSISSVEAQMEKYQQLLRKHCSTEAAILSYMLAYVNASDYIRAEGYGNKPADLPETSLVRENARLWHKIAQLHLRDVEDLEHNVGALRNALPTVPNSNSGRIPVMAPYSPRSDSNIFNVDSFTDTQDHLLTLTASGVHYSHLTKEDSHQANMDAFSYFNISEPKKTTTSTTPRPRTSPKRPATAGRSGLAGGYQLGMLSQPLTPEALDRMIFIHNRPRREVLGAIALPLAIAATAMGVFNRAQIEALKTELFDLKESTGRLFEVVQDFSKNMKSIETGFNELRTTLFYQVMFNPTLFDSRLTRLENQLRNRLRRVTHAIQAAIHQRFAVDYLNPAELALLYEKLEKKASESGCDLLIKYHSDLFQVEASLLFDGRDGHVLIHVPMTPRNSLLRLFRLHPFPLPLFESHHLIPDVKTDVLAISSTDTRYNVQLSSTDLLSCHRVNQIFMCDSFGVMSKRFDDTCLGSLYMQKFEAAQNLCKFKVIPVEEQVYQLRKGLFIVYSPEPNTASVKCRNGTHAEIHLRKGTQQVRISPGCQGFFSEHMVTSDYSVKLDSDILHFEWDWDPITFLPAGEVEEMAETLKHLKELKLHHPDLSELQYFTRLRETQNSSGSGLLQMTNGLTTVGVGLTFVFVIVVVFIVYYYCCRKRHHPTYSPAPAPTVILQPIQGYAAQPPAYSAERPRRSPRLMSKSGFCCASGSRSAVAADIPMAQYRVNEDDVTFWQPRNQRQRSQETTYASAPRSDVPSHIELQNRLNTLSH